MYAVPMQGTLGAAARNHGCGRMRAFGTHQEPPLISAWHPSFVQVQEVQPAILNLARAAYRAKYRIAPTVAAKRPASPELTKPRKLKKLHCFVCNGVGHKASTCPRRATLGALSRSGACVTSAWYHDASGEEEGPADWSAPESGGKNLEEALAAVAAEDI